MNQSQTDRLSQELWDAVERTVEDVAENDRHSRQFISKADLVQILNYPSLQRLFRELLPRDPIPEESDEYITRRIDATLGIPSRISLLALFLYENRDDLLSLYLRWLGALLGDDSAEYDGQIPSDDYMPFTTETLNQCRVPMRYHRSIFEKQAIFKPVTLRRLMHHEINNRERLPFIGRQKPIKSGSSGDVVKAEIAQGHWEIEENHEFVPGNPNNPMIVALKTFRAVDTVRDIVEATRDFKIELNILRELRDSKIGHDMILLDWGSITIVDERQTPLYHSLIFELADFSLEDYLKQQDLARQTIMPSGLLGSLVDIIEALSCLHDNLDTLHLDIKPDNILIFESHDVSGTNSRYDLIWKLSDFGLARKKYATQKARSAQASAATSLVSAVPATRPAGLYQAPEIQEQDISQAGRGSDVWSMGCVTLMVLALMIEGSDAVVRLESSLQVFFKNGGGREHLFYVRSDSHKWKTRMQNEYCYLRNRIPEEDLIPGTARPLRAALHPNLIEWSNMLLSEICARQVRQQFVLGILQVIFGEVLRIKRNERLTARNLYKRLADIQKEWELYELAPEDYSCRDISEHLYLEDGTSPHEPENSLRVPLEVSQVVQMPNTNNNTTSSPEAQPDTTGSLQQDQEIPTLDQRDDILKELCDAIERNDATSVRDQLGKNTDALSQLLPGPRKYPIHWALCNDAYKALDVLLEQATPGITRIVCDERTALDLACEFGKPAALDCIRKHRDKFTFPREIYERSKKTLGSEARKIADDLFGKRKSTSRLQESRRSSASAQSRQES